MSIRLKFNPHLECFIAEMSSFAENIATVSTATFCWTLRTLLRTAGIDERQRSSHLSYIRCLVVSGGVWWCLVVQPSGTILWKTRLQSSLSYSHLRPSCVVRCWVLSSPPLSGIREVLVIKKNPTVFFTRFVFTGVEGHNTVKQTHLPCTSW